MKLRLFDDHRKILVTAQNIPFLK